MRRLLSARNLLAFAILSLALFLALWVSRNYRGGIEDSVDIISPQVDLALKGFNYTETIAGRRQWVLIGDSAFHDIESGTTKIVDIDMVFYDEALGTINLKAREGTIDEEHRLVNIMGDVVVENPDRYTIKTDSLQFLVKEKVIETADFVKISSKDFDLTGKGMRFSTQTRELQLLSSVEANFKPQNKNGR